MTDATWFRSFISGICLTVLATAVCADELVTSIDKVGIRELPELDGRILGVVAIGTRLELLGRFEDWYQVRARPEGTREAVEGYVPAAVVDTRSEVSAERERPAAAPRPAPPGPREASYEASSPSRRVGLVVRGEWHAPVNAEQSFGTVYGESATRVGVGAAVAGLFGRHWLRLGGRYDRFSKSGEVVGLPSGGEEWVAIGVATRLRVQRFLGTLEVDLGRWRIRPYAAAAAGFAQVKESDAPGLEGDTRCAALELGAGLRMRPIPHLELALEGAKSWLPGAIGDAGISAYHDEDDLGGVSLAVVAGFWWGSR